MKFNIMNMKLAFLFVYYLASIFNEFGEMRVHVNGKILVRNYEDIATKIVQDAYGDVFHCVGIKEQPTFKHPLLKNHTIQMSPSSYPSLKNQNSSWKDIKLQSQISVVECPSGTIPVWKNYNKNTSISWIESLIYKQSESKPSKEDEFAGVHAAAIVRDGRLFGTRASTSVYELDIMAGKTGRNSGAYASLSNGTSADDLDFVTAGWFVWPQYSGDNHVRFFTYWKDSNRHKVCINLLCSGFVQVSSTIALGSRLQPVSVYGGTQHQITYQIFKDPKTGNWWLTFGKDNKPVGYWVNSVFNHMDNGAYKVDWGGVAEADPNEPSPPMGSGHFPSEGFGKAAFYKEIMIINDRHELIAPNTLKCYPFVSRTECYKVSRPWIANDGIGMFFGGPGGCKH